MIKVNEAPAITYNFLNINRTQIEVKAENLCVPQVSELPEGISLEQNADFSRIQTGLGKDFDSFFDTIATDKAGCSVYNVAAGKKINVPVRITFNPADKSFSYAQQVIVAEEGSESTFIMDYSGCSEGDFGLSTRVFVKENAMVHLVKVNLLSKTASHYDSIGTEVAENAKLETIQVELGAARTVTGTYNALCGRKSECSGFVAYTAKDEQDIDINYVVRQTGKETDSKMSVNGVVTDSARKTWRGTIDFVKGAKNAAGNETEDVLLLSPQVVNKTLPVILCDEEAVEGHHGASIGRLDDDMLFYLETRGVDRKTAETLMIKAKVNAVSSRIPDEGLKEKINNYLEEAFEK